jgi:hypothetical protein
MDFKKVLSILILVILAVILSGGVSSSDVSGIGGPDLQADISIDNVEFNIPEGYEKNTTKTIVNQTNTFGDMTYVLNQETFVSSDAKEIIISVVDLSGMDVDEQTLSQITQGAENKTLMGYQGYLKKDGNSITFGYRFNNKAVTITAPSEELINNILVMEDA